MKHVGIGLTLPLLLIGCTEGQPRTTKIAETRTTAIGWMAGCWQHSDGTSQEVWVEAPGGILFGHATTLKDGVLSSFEDLRVESAENNAVYVASPGGSTPVVFREVSRKEESIAFENPSHDFPQRIAYERTAQGMTATISLIDGDNVIQIPMTRCE